MKHTLIILLSVLSLSMNAQIKLQPMFSDNMVLQQQTSAPIWGEVAHGGATVSVKTSWNKKQYATTAKADGTWRVEVATPKAGGPYEIVVEETAEDGSKDAITLHNVLVGEVWLCTGQSNMEMPLDG